MFSKILADRGFNYLGQDHGGDLLGGEGVGAAQVLDLDLGVAIIIDDLEGPRLGVLLDGGVIGASTDQSPRKERETQSAASLR